MTKTYDYNGQDFKAVFFECKAMSSVREIFCTKHKIKY